MKNMNKYAKYAYLSTRKHPAKTPCSVWVGADEKMCFYFYEEISGRLA